jgi:hypothetical protein
MSDGKKPAMDPNKVVTREDGSKIRPGRFGSAGEGMSVAEPDQDEPSDDDSEDE